MLGLLGEKGGEEGLSPGGGHTPGLLKTSSAVRCPSKESDGKGKKSHLIPDVSGSSSMMQCAHIILALLCVLMGLFIQLHTWRN